MCTSSLFAELKPSLCSLHITINTRLDTDLVLYLEDNVLSVIVENESSSVRSPCSQSSPVCKSSGDSMPGPVSNSSPGSEYIPASKSSPESQSAQCLISSPDSECIPISKSSPDSLSSLVSRPDLEQYHNIQIRFPDIRLNPGSCRGLTICPSGEVQFNIQLRQTAEQTELHNGQKRATQTEMVEKVEASHDRWFCAACGQKLLNNSCIFSRVLPLPSENWFDFTDFWFCHKHGDGDNVPNKGKLLPKVKECFVGENYLLVDSGHIEPGAVRTVLDEGLVCGRCGRQIGTPYAQDQVSQINGKMMSVVSFVYKLFLHSILFEDHLKLGGREKDKEQNANMKDNTEQYLISLLLEQSRLYTSFRFIISSKSGQDSQVDCLLWLLEPDFCTVYSATATAGQGEVIAHRQRVLKLLYKCRILHKGKQKSMSDSMTSSLISMWKKDNTVHLYTLPHTLCLQMISLLIQSTKHLPTSHRYLNGFHVGFFRSSTEPR